MNCIITTDDLLIFRDGRPFGDTGYVRAGTLDWPPAAALTGMFRTALGWGRATDYFTGPQKADNIARIKQLRIRRLLPLARRLPDEDWKVLLPAPADAVWFADHATQTENRSLRLSAAHLEPLPSDCGCDEEVPGDWLFPMRDDLDAILKPAKAPPCTWWWDSMYRDWLTEDRRAGDFAEADVGLPGATRDFRTHVAIDPKTFAAKEGQLFTAHGIRLATKDAATQPWDLGLWAELEGTEPGDNGTFPKTCHLGGDRRTVWVEPRTDSLFPALIPFSAARFLRLILITPGEFGAWKPDWLTSDAFTAIPGLPTAKVRLRAAFIPRWQGISGWNYETNRPKAMRKQVPAGAVYVIELEDPSQAPTVADHFWGNRIACSPGGEDSALNLVVVGQADKLTEKI